MTERLLSILRAARVAVFLAMSLLSAPLHADNTAAAQALFSAGRDASRRGDTSEACARFRESYRLDPATGTRLNLAVCEAKLGRLAAAWQHYTALESALPPDDSRRAFVETGLRDVDARLPRVVFEAAAPLPNGLTLRVADLVITESGFRVPIPMDPGTHAIEITAPGRARGRTSLTLAEGERRSLRIEPLAPLPERPRAAVRPNAVVPPAALSDPQTPRGGRRAAESSVRATWGTIALGTGLASLVAGSVLGIGALNEKARMDRECNPGCSDEGLAAADRGTRYAIASTIGVVGGLAMGSAGVVVLLWSSEPDAAHDAGVERAAVFWRGRF